jgi:hypothetical protein
VGNKEALITPFNALLPPLRTCLDLSPAGTSTSTKGLHAASVTLYTQHMSQHVPPYAWAALMKFGRREIADRLANGL